MLDVRNLCVSYGQHRALEDVSIHVDPGKIVVILGANGAGKSTLLRLISGICEGHHRGEVEMDGHPILGLTSDKLVNRGVVLVPEGRGIFGDLSVHENLRLGAYSERAREDEAANFDRVISLFPKLGERKSQIARTMSGGEQQMVAIGRAIMSNPKILMLDEPSLGLSPLLCKELFANLKKVRDSGISILLVEQNAKQSLAIADRGYLLENAHIVHEDNAAGLMNDPAVQKAYLGAGAAKTSPPPVQTTPTVSGLAISPNEIAARAIASYASDTPTDPTPQPTVPTQKQVSKPVPKKLVTSGGPPPRRSADELAGFLIDDLVNKAALQASRSPEATKNPQSSSRRKAYVAPAPSTETSKPSQPIQKRTRTSPISPSATHEERLRATLTEIEQAAERARNRVRSRTRR